MTTTAMANEATTTAAAEPVTELWILRIDGPEDAVGNIVRAVDDCGDPVLAYRSEAEAVDAAAYHWEEYDIRCHPERVFPAAA